MDYHHQPAVDAINNIAEAIRAHAEAIRAHAEALTQAAPAPAEKKTRAKKSEAHSAEPAAAAADMSHPFFAGVPPAPPPMSTPPAAPPAPPAPPATAPAAPPAAVFIPPDMNDPKFAQILDLASKVATSRGDPLVIEVIGKYGASSLPSLPKDKYDTIILHFQHVLNGGAP